MCGGCLMMEVGVAPPSLIHDNQIRNIGPLPYAFCNNNNNNNIYAGNVVGDTVILIRCFVYQLIETLYKVSLLQ